jgi:hypothetical protein
VDAAEKIGGMPARSHKARRGSDGNTAVAMQSVLGTEMVAPRSWKPLAEEKEAAAPQPLAMETRPVRGDSVSPPEASHETSVMLTAPHGLPMPTPTSSTSTRSLKHDPARPKSRPKYDPGIDPLVCPALAVATAAGVAAATAVFLTSDAAPLTSSMLAPELFFPTGEFVPVDIAPDVLQAASDGMSPDGADALLGGDAADGIGGAADGMDGVADAAGSAGDACGGMCDGLGEFVTGFGQCMSNVGECIGPACSILGEVICCPLMMLE